MFRGFLREGIVVKVTETRLVSGDTQLGDVGGSARDRNGPSLKMAVSGKEGRDVRVSAWVSNPAARGHVQIMYILYMLHSFRRLVLFLPVRPGELVHNNCCGRLP